MSVFCCLLQWPLIYLPGPAKRWVPRFYWSSACRVMGIRVRVYGKRAKTSRSVIFIANHSSWMDIPLLGGCLSACFVSKDEVRRWPGINIVAKMGRTVFVSRGRSNVGRERTDMQKRLATRDDLILFPEGTSSDGARVLPFRSAFFSLADGDDPPTLQPVSIAYDTLDGLPILRSNRADIGWYGAMDLVPHLWRIASHASVGVSVRLHPVPDTVFGSRKAMAAAMHGIIAASAASQRRHTPITD